MKKIALLFMVITFILVGSSGFSQAPYEFKNPVKFLPSAKIKVERVKSYTDNVSNFRETREAHLNPVKFLPSSFSNPTTPNGSIVNTAENANKINDVKEFAENEFTAKKPVRTDVSKKESTDLITSETVIEKKEK